MPNEDVWFQAAVGAHLFGPYVEFLVTNVALLWCNGDAGNLIHRLVAGLKCVSKGLAQPPRRAAARRVVCEPSERLAVRGMLFMKVKVGNAIATTNEVGRLAVSPNLGRIRFCRVG